MFPLLCLSCHGYRDLWRPFVKSIERHWPDQISRMFLVTDTGGFDPGVRVLETGITNWSDSMIRVLESSDLAAAEYVYVVLDDFLLKHRVDLTQVRSLERYVLERGMDCTYVDERRDLGLFVPYDTEFVSVPVGVPYRVSAQPALWRKDALRKVIEQGETIWQFELHGTQRSGCLPQVSVARTPIVRCGRHAIERGAWFPLATRSRDAGWEADVARTRNVHPLSHEFRWAARRMISIFLGLSPVRPLGRWLQRRGFQRALGNASNRR